MKTTKISALIILCVLTLATLGSIASATPDINGRAAQVITTLVPVPGTGFGTEVTQFQQTETVYIEYNIEDDKNAVITVENEAGTLMSINDGSTTDTSFIVTASGELSIVGPLANDYYYVYVNGARAKTIAVASFFVVPESAFGALAALGAGVAAFGLIKMKKVKINIF